MSLHMTNDKSPFPVSVLTGRRHAPRRECAKADSPSRTAALSVLLSAMLLILGCADPVTACAAETTPEQTMVFTDVRGVEHTLTIDTAAQMHDYDPDSFLTIGQNIIYTDSTQYTWRIGVDVSYYQGDIDWESVMAAGYQYAFIRVGYRGYGKRGALVEDETFRANLAGAKAAGLDVGVYIFSQAVDETEAAEEASFVLSLLDGAELDLPVMYDPEFILNADGSRASYARTSTLSGAQVTLNTLTFCSIIEAAGYESGFYSNLLDESEVFQMSLLSQYTTWYADYNAVPQTPYDFTYWQFTSSGYVPGIDTNVDLNLQLLPVE